ncbi:hypothetical protein LIER_15165 [Lithospermum erythrorhizon]|uniref:Uncharacterized protein n=1 Tax=Lithospermum erythrorhizon TaxID=34254 RepID=A0AAV3Q3E5_LITER
MLILPRVLACAYCGAYKFYKETTHFCCSSGQVSIATHILPEYLVSLLTEQGDDSKDFHTMLCTYNNHFAYSSMGIHCDAQLQQRKHGIYTVRAQGQIHHFLHDLLPTNPSSLTSGLHLYFYDPVEQVAARTNTLPRLKPSTVVGLVKTLHSIRGYNKPTSTEVVGIWLEDESGTANSYERDIRVYARSGHSHNIQYYYACYDPLQYVLMFHVGEPGWHGNIPTVGSILVESSSAGVPEGLVLDNDQPCSLDALLASETAAHIDVQIRDINNLIVFESRSIVRNKKRSTDKLWVEHYKGVMDSTVLGVRKGGRVGTRVYLPPSFIGGPRDMRHHFLIRCRLSKNLEDRRFSSP